MASQVVLLVKNLLANARDIRDSGLVPVLGGSPGEMVTHSSILVWEIPQTEASCGLQSMRLQSQT